MIGCGGVRCIVGIDGGTNCVLGFTAPLSAVWRRLTAGCVLTGVVVGSDPRTLADWVACCTAGEGVGGVELSLYPSRRSPSNTIGTI